VVDDLGAVKHGHVRGLPQFSGQPGEQRVDQRAQVQHVVEAERGGQAVRCRGSRTAGLGLGDETAVFSARPGCGAASFSDVKAACQLVQGQAARCAADYRQDPQRPVHALLPGDSPWSTACSAPVSFRSRNSAGRNDRPDGGSSLACRPARRHVSTGSASLRRFSVPPGQHPAGCASRSVPASQKKVWIASITRYSSSTTGMTRHLSKVVHGCEMPRQIRSPAASGDSSGTLRCAC